MPMKCFVPNCKSGYRHCTDRVPMFKAPSDHARLELWRQAIPRTDKILQPSHHVCAKHFPENMISKFYYAEYKGNVILNVPKRPVLLADAVPSIFPGCPKYLTRLQSAKKSLTRRQSAATSAKRLASGTVTLPSETASEKQSDGNPAASPCKELRAAGAPCVQAHQGACPSAEMKLGGPSSVDPGPVKDNRRSPDHDGQDELCHFKPEAPLVVCISPRLVQESHEGLSVSDQNEQEPVTFSRLSSFVYSIQLPGTAWAAQIVDSFGVRAVIFTEAALPKNRNHAPFQKKTLEVTVSSRGVLSLRTFIYGQPIPAKAISGFASCGISDLENVIHKFHSLHVCAGGPCGEMYCNIRTDCAYVDASGVWRHRNCKLFSEAASCDRCGRLKETLRMRASRMQRRSET